MALLHPRTHLMSVSRGRDQVPMLPWRRAPPAPPPPPPPPLAPLDRQQRAAAAVLRVHALSAALRFEPLAPLRVDAARWWDELRQQSSAAVQTRHSRKRRLQPRNEATRDADDDHELLVETLLRVLHSAALWTQRDDARDPELRELLDDIRDAIGDVGAMLLDAWRRIGNQGPDADADAKCAVDVVNVLLQVDRRVGAFHAFHDHKLCASTAQRLFRAAPAWSCSRCERAWETHGATAPVLVFSCAACAFTICRECYTRVPNASVELQALALAREAFQPLQAQWFLPLAMRRLLEQDRELFLTLAPKIAVAARGRLHDLLLYRSDEMVPMMEMVLELFSIPEFPRIFIDKEPQMWLPVYISSAKLRLHTFLGPLMWWTSMSDEPGEINLTPDGRRDGSAMALTLQWHEGYRILRNKLARLFEILLDDNAQDPYVVDATLTYLATTIVCFQSYRSSGSGNDDLYDGYLVNISSALVHVALPMLSKNREALQATYHEGFVSRRVYHHKVEPLRKPSSEDETALRAADDERVKHADTEMSEKRKSGKVPAAEFYYPHNSKHFGVLCDFCNGADFVGLRYKCAICDDADICASCYDDFSRRPVQDEAVQEAQRAQHPDQFHCTDHVFLRLDVPVPLIAANHYDPFECDLKALLYKEGAEDDRERDTADTISQELICADCGVHLDSFDVYYRCSNCIDPRFVCPHCLEQEEQYHDPNRVHLPGHVYMGIPRPWRKHFNPRGTGLLSRGLVYPACIYPRERFNTATELLYMTVESLHVGPLHALSKLMTVVKETHELRSFCACEEQRVEYERLQQHLRGPGGRRPKLSPHYAASQARLADLAATRLMSEMHLLETSNVIDWIAFYSGTCRWLLEIASTTQNAFKTIVTQFSSAFSSFPEHFFFDLCDIVHVLTLDGTTSNGGGTGGVDYQKAFAEETQSPQILEPIFVMLVQLIATRKCTRNPHLRVQAAKAMSSLLGFYAKTNALVVVLRKVFHRCLVLRDSAVRAVLQFHEDMEGYHLRNNGLVFNNNAGNGDHLLWGFLSIRVTTVLLLRFMWQFSDQRVELARAFQAKNNTPQVAAPAGEPPVDVQAEARLSTQVSMLLTGLWSDAAKLLEESNGKVGVLTQLADVREALLEGRQIQLPFRPSMLEGYIALHSKHLRISMRMLVEVLELLSWIADNAQLKRSMLKPELTDQCARTTSFLISSIASAFKSDSLNFTWHHLEDTKRVFANLVFLVSRCAAMEYNSEKATSPSPFWSLVQDSAATMLRFIGDAEVHNRWTLNRAVIRLETARYLGEDTGEDAIGHRKRDTGGRVARRIDKFGDDSSIPTDDYDENDALAFLEQQSAQNLTALNTSSPTKGHRGLARQLGTRFVSALAKDGRFDYELFLSGCDLLLRRASRPSGMVPDNDRDYELVGLSWMTVFMSVLRRCQDTVTLLAAMDELLADIPEEFLDPLLNTIMTDPVRLPSGNVVDRAVIERHLLSANRVDPFTREPLTVGMLEPCHALRREIQSYLQRKLQHLDTRKEDVLASWGLAWDCIFDVAGEAAI